MYPEIHVSRFVASLCVVIWRQSYKQTASEAHGHQKLAQTAQGRKLQAKVKLSKKQEQHERNAEALQSEIQSLTEEFPRLDRHINHRKHDHARPGDSNGPLLGPRPLTAETRQEPRRAYAEISEKQNLVEDQRKQIEILRRAFNDPEGPGPDKPRQILGYHSQHG